MSLLQPDQPLYLPEGSIRAVLALSAMGAFIAGLIPNDIAFLVLGFYFASRAEAGTPRA